ncbi:MAG TPA: TonB-dependent receptor, partial [Alphaproteobacteria bacterium]
MGLSVIMGVGGTVAGGGAGAQDGTATPGPEIVVSASRVPLPTHESGSAVTVLTGEQLEARGIRIVSDVLRDVPGLAVSRTGSVGGFTQVRIRGAEGNHTLVLIDGIEVNNPAGGSEFDFAHLLAAEIARIEVLRGPQSALYGSDAIGGVINIVTKRPGRGWSATGRGEAGSFSTWDGLGHVGYGGERFYVGATFDRFATGGISEADRDNGNFEEDSYDNATTHLKAGLRPMRNLEIEAVAMHIDSERDTDDSAVIVNAVDGDGSSATLQRYGLARAKWTLMGGAWEHILRAAYTEDGTEFFDGSGTKTFENQGRKTKFDYQTNVFFATPGIADAEHTFTLAAEREEDEQFTESDFFGPNTVSIENDGYVGEYRVALWNRLFLSAGLRFDDNDELFSDEVTWRGTAAYLHEPWRTRFHASIGRGVKNPTLFELFGATPTFTGNPDLEPEESIGFDVGTEHSMLGGRLVADVTYFHNRFENFIDGIGETATNLPGITRAHGIEVTVAYEPIPSLRIDGAYTFTDTEDAEGNRLIRRARHIASLNAAYGFDLDRRPATVNLGIRYNGDQTDRVFDSFFPVVERGVKLEGYALVNLALSWRIAPNLEVFARGENLLDQNYQDVFGFGTPGFAAYGGLRVRFGPA